jgi:hypothetical protein
MALFVSFLVTLALGLLGSSLLLRMRLVIFEIETVNLITLADGVLSESLANLYADENFGGVPEHLMGHGKVRSEIRALDSPAPGQRRYEIVATSKVRLRERAVRAEVLREVEEGEGGGGLGAGRVRLRVVRWERVREGEDEGEGKF